MHGHKNIKLCNAEQAKRVYKYKNIKLKFYKNKAAIWYNKICRARHLTPNYANVNIQGTNSRCQRTKDAAIRFRINQELKFQLLLLLLLVFSPWAGLGRDQSSVRRLVWLWYAASWANS